MATVGNTHPYAEKLVSFGNKLGLNEEQFEAASATAEYELKNEPARYKLKVAALAFLGYAFIGLIIASVGLALWGCWHLANSGHMRLYGWKLPLVLVLMLIGLLKSLWIKVPQPEGIEVRRKDAPALFEMIDELSAALNTRVDKVLLNGDYNASVVQVPKLGFLGVFRNYLNLGLPMMLIHSADEFKAVVAHELGHLSGNHSKSKAWIYHLRLRWQKLLTSSENDTFFALFFLFFSWFSPRFDAYTLALARTHELEADADAVKISGADAFSLGMMRLETMGNLIERNFWKNITDTIGTLARPPEDSFEMYRSEVTAAVHDREVLKRSLSEAFKRKGEPNSTHPSLKQRLLEGKFETVVSLDDDSVPDDRIINQLLNPIDTAHSAGAVYLGAWLDQALKKQSAVWARAISDYWHYEHTHRKAAIERLSAIDALAEKQDLASEELREKASILLSLDQEDLTLPIFRLLYERDPDDVLAQFNVGLLLLKAENDESIEVLKSVFAKRLSLAGIGCPTAINYLKKRGRLAEVKHFEDVLNQYEIEAALAKKERLGVDGKSLLEPSQLTEEQRDYLNGVFAQFKDIAYVFIVRKKVQHFSYLPYLVIGIEMNDEGGKLQMALWVKQNVVLPHEFCVTTFELGSKSLRENMKAVPGSLVYSSFKK